MNPNHDKTDSYIVRKTRETLVNIYFLICNPTLCCIKHIFCNV